MKLLQEKLMKLINLKSIIILILCIAMVFFTAFRVIGPEMFIAVGTSTFAYFFTKRQGD